MSVARSFFLSALLVSANPSQLPAQSARERLRRRIRRDLPRLYVPK